jgi:hypothetical protein
MKVRQILNKRNYTNRAYARDRDDEPVHWSDYSLVSLSLLGAICRVYPLRKRRQVYEAIRLYLFKTHRYSGPIWKWEDKSSWWEVEDLLKWMDI